MTSATTMVVVVESREGCEGIVAAAAERAERAGARLRIVTVPFRVPLSAGCSAFGMSQPWSVSSLRAAAQTEAVSFSRHAAGRVPAGVPTEHRVALGSLHTELERILGDALVSYVLVDRRLLRRRPRARRLLSRAREQGVEVAVAVTKGAAGGCQGPGSRVLEEHVVGPDGAIGA